jgi:hypothetical protein
MKNSQCQEACSINQPPSTGPIAEVIAVKPDQIPIALPRRSGGNVALIIAKLPGMSKAPPIPWIDRAQISCCTLGDNPHQTDARVNKVTPIVKIRRRPKRWRSLPEVIAQSTANENQGSDKQCVGLYHPLDIGCGCAEFGLENRQCHVDDRAIVRVASALPNRGHTGAENGRDQDPYLGTGSAGSQTRLRMDRPFIARLFDDVSH